MDSLCALSDTIRDMEAVEMRLSPDETAYVINLTGEEAGRVLAVLPDSAETLFETSVSCIGASICQIGLRDSQSLLRACVHAVKEAGIPDGALPQIHISGCPSSCGTHQTGAIGFRGAAASVDGKAQSAFMLYVNGCDRQGEETMGYECGTVLESDVPAFLLELGKTVAASGLTYEAWAKENPEAIRTLAEKYVVKK
jgi:ferredoxin-nitrite reductase